MSFLLNVVALPCEKAPDWKAAEGRIDALVLEDLDRFFGYWDPDGDLREEAVDDDDYLPKLKEELRSSLESVRRSMDDYSRDSASFDFARFRFLATGGPSVGSVPTELYDAISSLDAVGALGVAGFVSVYVDGPDDEVPDWPEPPQA